MNQNLPPDGYADEPSSSGPPDGYADEQVSQPQGQKSLLGKGIDAYKSYANFVEPATPTGLLRRADSAIRQGADYVGEKIAEFGGRQGFPKTAAAVGTVASMAPDIAMTVAAPQSALKAPTKPLFRSVSEPMAQRALGLTKRFLNTPFARGKARQAAGVALDEGIIPISGSADEAMARAVDLQTKSGETLGAMRESAGASSIDPVFDSLEAARKNATGGMRGGAWDTVHRKFDEAQETLFSLLNQGPEVALREVERVKKLLSKTVNWVADNVSQETAKQISSAIENGVENIMRSKGINMAEYGTQKTIYGASKTMQKGLANEVAAQAGNNAVSLPTMVLGAGQLAKGNVPGAAATIGLTETLRRRGAGAGAAALEKSGRFLASQVPSKRLLKLPVAVNSIFPAKQSLQANPVPIQNMLRPRQGVEKGSDGYTNPGNGHMAQPNNNGNEQQDQNNGYGNFEGVANHGPILSTPNANTQGKSKELTKAKAKEFYDQADGDPVLARKLAKKAGYSW